MLIYDHGHLTGTILVHFIYLYMSEAFWKWSDHFQRVVHKCHMSHCNVLQGMPEGSEAKKKKKTWQFTNSIHAIWCTLFVNILLKINLFPTNTNVTIAKIIFNSVAEFSPSGTTPTSTVFFLFIYLFIYLFIHLFFHLFFFIFVVGGLLPILMYHITATYVYTLVQWWCHSVMLLNLHMVVGSSDSDSSGDTATSVCVINEKDMALQWQIWSPFVTVLWCSKTKITEETRILGLVRVLCDMISKIYWQILHSFFKNVLESSYNLK